jgi:hypothetical protein
LNNRFYHQTIGTIETAEQQKFTIQWSNCARLKRS